MEERKKSQGLKATSWMEVGVGGSFRETARKPKEGRARLWEKRNISQSDPERSAHSGNPTVTDHLGCLIYHFFF